MKCLFVISCPQGGGKETGEGQTPHSANPSNPCIQIGLKKNGLKLIEREPFSDGCHTMNVFF